MKKDMIIPEIMATFLAIVSVICFWFEKELPCIVCMTCSTLILISGLLIGLKEDYKPKQYVHD